MDAGRQFQNVDLLKLLVRGNQRGAVDTHRAEPVTRTPTPNGDAEFLKFSGFGPVPCLDLKPVSTAPATEEIMDTSLCSCSAAPPPYQLHTPPLPPAVLSLDRPQSSSVAADGLRYSALTASSRLSDASLPIYETYRDLPSSAANGHELAPEQLRNGIKALFQVSTPLASRARPASTATTVSAVFVSNHDPLAGPGQEAKRHPGALELPGHADSDPRGQLRSRYSAPMFASTTHTRDLRKSEPYGRKPDTQYTLNHTVDPLLAELDGTVPVSAPAELGNTEPRYQVAELDTGTGKTLMSNEANTETEKPIITDKSGPQARLPEMEDTSDKMIAATETISEVADTSSSGSIAEGKETPSTSSSIETGRMGLLKDREAQAEWLRRSSLLQP